MNRLRSLLPLFAEGTLLRQLQASDLERFNAYRSDPVLALYQGWSPMSLPEAKQFIDAMTDVTDLRAGDWIQLAIAEAASNALIGDVGLFLEADGSTVELGFTLCRGAQGQGHATRAASLAVILAYAATTARVVRAVTDVRNGASVRVLERAGFARSLAQESLFKGEPCVEALYFHHRPGA